MNTEKLNTLLKQLHTELENADSLDPASRDSLQTLTADIQRLLDGETTPADLNLIERLQVEVLKFELSHPSLTQAISQITKILADAGV